MFETDDFLPLSGLQHLVYCERQCALIHVEGVWLENASTASGRLLHERVDTPEHTTRPGVRVERALPLRSERLRLIGRADVVELHSPGARVCPVEYKRGSRSKLRVADEVQLCAQGMALEEMLGVEVEGGAIFYGRSKRRREVAFGGELRERVVEAARRFHELVRARSSPRAAPGPRCRDCSLWDLCLPGVTGEARGAAAAYLAGAFGVE